MYIILLWPIPVLTKYLSRRKKVYIKAFLNRFMLILIIYKSCHLQRYLLPYITKSWWYCRCKLPKSEKWCHPMKDDYTWQEPNPRCSKLFSFKVGLSPSKKNCVNCFIVSPIKVMKNAFYSILKALFVLKILKFLIWLCGHVGKTAWLES